MPTLLLLGCPQLLRPGAAALPLGPERRLQWLALLACERHWVPRERLAELFWPGRDAATARTNLRAGLEDGPAGLRWCPATDLQAFETACGAADWAGAAAAGEGLLMQVLDDARTPPPFTEWLQLERSDHARRWRAAVLKLIEAADAAAALAWAQRLLARDPLDEEALAAALRAAHSLSQTGTVAELWHRYCNELAESLGLAPSPALQALAEGQVRPALAPLLGRHREKQALTELITAQRLVTLFGPGGAGKTRLARHMAALLAPRFAQGAHFVACGEVGTPAALPARVAAALGLTLSASGDPVAELARRLAPGSLLLVLDGFASLIDAAGHLQAWLEAAPGLRLLVTSRERLEIEGEWLLALGGMALPEAGATREQMLASEAVQLFAERARAVQHRFELDAEINTVTEICRRVAGLPLALELAAAWVRLMPAREVAAELAQGIELLGSGLEAVFDRSWALLTWAERDAFARLAVFHGGFTREVAAVALPLIAALADKSMLDAGDGGRLAMHPLLLAFAQRKLLLRADAAAWAERHSRWFLARLQRGHAHADDEHENLIAAWRQAVARHDIVAIESALRVLPLRYSMNGRIAEAALLFDEAARHLGDATAAAAHVRAHQAWMLLWCERYDEAAAIARGALGLLERAGHDAGVVMAQRVLGHAARRDGRTAQACQHFEAALARAESTGLTAQAAALHDALAMALNMQGGYAAAREHVLRALPLNEALGDDAQRMYNAFNLSQSHSLAGEPVPALPWAQDALARAERIGHAIFAPYAGVELATVMLALGRPADAAAQAALALERACLHGDRAAQACVQEVLARIALADGDTAAARLACRSAAALLAAIAERETTSERAPA